MWRRSAWTVTPRVTSSSAAAITPKAISPAVALRSAAEPAAGEDAAAAVDQLAGEGVELGGELADHALQGLHLRAQGELAWPQREGALVFERGGEQLMDLAALLPTAGVGDVRDPARQQREVLGELGARRLQPRIRVELVEAADEEAERMHGEVELVHALEAVDVEVEHALARRLALGEAGAHPGRDRAAAGW